MRAVVARLPEGDKEPRQVGGLTSVKVFLFVHDSMLLVSLAQVTWRCLGELRNNPRNLFTKKLLL